MSHTVTTTAPNVTRAVYLPGEGIRIENNTLRADEDFIVGRNSRIDLNRLPIKTSFQRVALEEDIDHKETMSKDEIEALRKSVIRSNRPLNPWFDGHKPFCSPSEFLKSDNKLVYATEASNKPDLKLTSNPLVSKKTTSNATFITKSQTNNKEVNDALKRYSSTVQPGLSLKQQLLQQQEKKQQNVDYDISKALASEIKMLEQLEIEHLKRANNLAMASAETSSAESSGSAGSLEVCVEPFKQIREKPRQRPTSGPSPSGEIKLLNVRQKKEDNKTDSMGYNHNEKIIAQQCHEKENIKNNYWNTDRKVSKKEFYNEHNVNKADGRTPTVSPHLEKILENKHSQKKYSAKRNPSPILSCTLKNQQICHSCGNAIHDVILQALGGTYHAKCFRCTRCQRCLDGIPFAVDTSGKVFCMNDYEEMFIPACVVCHKSISAINEFGQIIRIVFQNQEYHIDCFNCEGCGLQLSNEQPNRCYPLSSHLLCHHCHIQWKRLGGADQPITDL